jgi:preprotein translocase subunit SecD
MKKIIYLLIAVFIFGIVANGFKNLSKQKESILIQSVDSKMTSAMLSQSAKIISGRLRSFSSAKYELKVIPEKNQIQVIFAGNTDLKTVEGLLTEQGAFAFYASYDHDSLTKLLKGDSRLFSLLKATETSHPSAKIGCTTVAEVEKVNRYLNSLALNQQCKFAWSQPSEKKEVCLYALRLEGSKGAILTGADIENINFGMEKEAESYAITIEFKKEAIPVWADATRHNINNAIAIVLDNQVIYAPKLKSVIEGGKCEITGKFTESEARFIAALGNNGVLPVSFKVIR